MFTNQLSAMISANLPLARILDGLSKEALNRHLSNIIRNLKRDVESGVDFGLAIARYPTVFDALYVNMVKAGMATGHLDRTLKQLTIYMEKTAATRGKLRTALTYPFFMICFLSFVFFVMVFKILPMFENMFASFGDRLLPLPTRIMLGAGDIISDNLYLIIITLLLAFILCVFIPKINRTKFFWDKYKLKIPLIGGLIKKTALGKFLRAFSLLTQSEVHILESLKLVSSTGYNRFMEFKINQAADMIERGSSVAAAFQRTGFFPDIIIQMISSGEKTGNLGDLMENAANFYDDQVEETTKSLLTLINPLITIIVGGTVGLMMIAIFLPIFEMGSAVRG